MLYTYLQLAVLRLNGNDLISNQLENPVDNRLKALQDFFIGKGHVAFFNSSLRELGLDANIDSPLLTIVSEVGLDPVLEIHDTLGVHSAGSL